MPAARRCGRASFRAFLKRAPSSLLDEAGDNFAPDKILAVMLQQREVRRPQRALGRHRHDRGRGLGRRRQDRGEAAASPARRALQRRQGRGESLLLCRRRLVCAGQDHQGPAGRDEGPSRCRLYDGEDESRRHAAARTISPASKRSSRSCRRAASSRSTPIRNFSATRRWLMRKASNRSGCAGSRSRAIRSTSRCSPRSPASMTRRCRPARICSRRRMSRTWCASAA